MGELRDAARTRKKIVEAAREEFAACGFVGARIEAIAQRAGLSKQLLYHYFKNKDALIEEILEQKFQQRATLAEEDGPASILLRRFSVACEDPIWVRFLVWEAAEFPNSRRFAAEKPRREAIARQSAAIRRGQRRGEIPKDLPADLVNLAVQALATYPLAFGQITTMITGTGAHDLKFQRRWKMFLKKLGDKLVPE